MGQKDWRTRLKDAIDASDLSRAEIARRAGLNLTMLRDILDRGRTPSVDNLARIARVLNLSLGNLYDGDIIRTVNIVVSGSLVGGEMVAQYAPEFAPVVPFQILPEDLAFVRIDTDDFQPAYRRGDLIGGLRTTGPNVHNLIRRECIVHTLDEQEYVGILMPGSKPDHYTIRSLVPGHDDTPNVRIAWAAPISLIMRH